MSIAAAEKGPACVTYVEINMTNITSVEQYVFEDGSNTFNIAIIFATNIS